MTPFSREQKAQEAIGLIQTRWHVSILQINETIVRELVDTGKTPTQIADLWLLSLRPLGMAS